MSQKQAFRNNLSPELELVLTDPDSSLSAGAERTIRCVIASLEMRAKYGVAALSATPSAQADNALTQLLANPAKADPEIARAVQAGFWSMFDAQVEPIKDNQIAQIVNQLRAVAKEFHNTEQLRERIAHIIVPALKAAQAGKGEVAGWRPLLKDRPKHLPPSDFTAGEPSKQTIDYWRARGVEIEYAYTTPQPQPVPAGSIKFTAAHEDYVVHFTKGCRDCADNNGVCPNSGLPCSGYREAIKTVLKALEYGINNGHAPDPAQPQPCAVPEVVWPKARDVGRFGDMGKGAHLRIGLDSDNDVYVSVWDEKGGASVEFCNPGGGGGGQSSKTRVALIAAMVAMEQDNALSPAKDWWAQRAMPASPTPQAQS